MVIKRGSGEPPSIPRDTVIYSKGNSMSRVCEVTRQEAAVGNRVYHRNKKKRGASDQPDTRSVLGRNGKGVGCHADHHQAACATREGGIERCRRAEAQGASYRRPPQEPPCVRRSSCVLGRKKPHQKNGLLRDNQEPSACTPTSWKCAVRPHARIARSLQESKSKGNSGRRRLPRKLPEVENDVAGA